MKTRSILHFILVVAACIPSFALADRTVSKDPNNLASISIQPDEDDLCMNPPPVLTIRYNCNGQTNAADYEVVSGSYVVTYDPYFQTYASLPMLVTMSRSRRLLHLVVGVNGADCSSASVFSLDLGIQRMGQNLLDASATSSSFGSKPYGEQLTISTGSPAGWAGCSIAITR